MSPHACSDVARCRSGRSLSDFVVCLPYFPPDVVLPDVGLVAGFRVEQVVNQIGHVGLFHVGSQTDYRVVACVGNRLQTSNGSPGGWVVHCVVRNSSGYLHVNGVRLRLQTHWRTEFGLIVGVRRIRFRRFSVVGARRIRFRCSEVGPISIHAYQGGCFPASRGGSVPDCTEGG